MAERNEIVRVEGLVKEFRSGFSWKPKRALGGISFNVFEGEIFGFVGPNGAGKTTTLKILMGLIRPTSGEASLLGHQVGESEFRRQVGFLPENPYFYDYLTASEILDFFARVSGVPRAERAQRVRTLLEWVGLDHVAAERLRGYSKGMLQRIGIAQALVHDPKVVFLDEPMSGLDPIGRKEIRDLILRLRSEGKTVFMNTHILSDVESVCDRVAIIAGGQIRYEGRIESFLGEEERRSDVVLARVPAKALVKMEKVFDAEARGIGERTEFCIAEKKVNALLQMALDSDAEVISVAAHRASLEDVFLEAVHASRENR